MLEGEYKKALDLSLAAAEKSETKPGTNNLRPHPAFDMRIDTPGHHAVRDYLRTTDFESGEVKIVWTDGQGQWVRRAFVSRPDNVVVQLLIAPSGGEIDATLRLDASMVLGNDNSDVPAKGRETIRIADGSGPPLHLHQPGAEEIHFAQSLDLSHLTLQGHYIVDQGTPGYASVTRVFLDGGSSKIDGNSLVFEEFTHLR